MTLIVVRFVFLIWLVQEICFALQLHVIQYNSFLLLVNLSIHCIFQLIILKFVRKFSLYLCVVVCVHVQVPDPNKKIDGCPVVNKPIMVISVSHVLTFILFLLFL